MIKQFISFVIRPPRAVYDPDKYLWEKDFTLSGKAYKREDLELQNGRGQTLRCSHYVPSVYPEDSALPCVIYCHGNSGCRVDANEAVVVLLPANITVFTLDFSGSGLSEGSYVSLGWHEKDDLGVVVSYLRNDKLVSRIGLWGRSMGAVTSLLYGSEDPSITGMVVDSAFSDLLDLSMELVDVYKIRLPKFSVKMAVQYMRRVIQKRANFDMKDLNCKQVASKTHVPALIAHANEDIFIQPHHSDIIFKLYAGEKNIIKFDGDHNSPRPQFYYDSVSLFFNKTLKPPHSSVWSNNIATADMNENVTFDGDIHVADECCLMNKGKDYLNGSVEKCCSYTSSTRESWGRCSSLEDSDSAEDALEVSGQRAAESPPLHIGKSPINRVAMVAPAGLKKPKHERSERLADFGRRLRLSIIKQVKHGKYGS